ncbi:ComF family protein [Arenimonas oryziterrae]|uniref:Double zinc ribbon domain-containing protein n=1 Tax=Arenimonas oryziterrae DSM 21050 = YC6267 TaxID=1121015 RepID=A0A091AUF1_9GAMM|nr:ComF family protein [Arenimonas oryziterrae]KFN43868.1 hypothetical protein N789_07935 [Arenimonas oryziterrae DSM 21050 = YC6267]
MRKLVDGITFCGFALLAARCLVCRERGGERSDLCPDCRASLPWNDRACLRCGLPMATATTICGACLRHPPPFAVTQAVFRYGFPLDRLLPRFKFHADLAAGALIAELALPRLSRAERPQLLVPVPLHRRRLRERGYDQALELAKALSRPLQLPLAVALLHRRAATVAQSRLDAPGRRRNVRGAFVCSPGPLPAHVALVDDVMTTGATVRECALALRRAGVGRVDVWVIARAS